MKDRGQLHALCAEWRRLTESEGAAIRMANWLVVSECQDRKKALQPEISSEARRVEARLDDLETGPLVKVLIAMELSNQQLLAQQNQELSKKRDAIARASRDLRRVRSAYSAPRDPLWNTFS